MRAAFHLMTSSALASLTIWPAALSAQVAEPPASQDAPASPAASDLSQIGDVVVTAQRRAENLQRTPIAVTALSPTTLSERSVRTSQELMQVVPSLQVSTQTAGDGGGSATFFLRGMGQQRAGNGSQPAVGIYIDDFYYPSLEGSIFSILDIQQVEVLRGPQGTLFGRNTIGGAIRYTTAKPEFGEFGGYGSATYGSFDRFDLSGALNLPIGDKVAVRLTGGRLYSDGYDKSALDGKELGGSTTTLERIQVRARPTDNVTIDLQGAHSHDFVDGFAYYLPGPFDHGKVTGIWNSIPPLGGTNPYDSRYQSQCHYCEPGTNPREFSRVTNNVANGVVAWDASDAFTLKSLSGYIKVRSTGFVDLDGSPLPVIQFDQGSNIRAYSQEFQFNGHLFDNRLKYTSGLYYYDAKSHDENTATVIAARGAPTITDRTTLSRAAYVDLTGKLTDALSILGGYRYSEDRQEATSGTLHGRKSFGSGTGRLGIQYQITPDAMTYASVSQGFRAGGFNRLQDGTLQSFRPENSTSYEVGGRFGLLEHKLRFNPTLFYTRWTDIQVQRIQYILDANGNPTTTFLTLFDNAAKAHTYGLELEADAAVTKSLHLFGHAATLKAKYDDVGDANGITTHSLFQRAPKFSFGVGGNYRADLGSAGSVVGTVNYSWQSSQASTPTDSDRLIIPSYGVMNLRLEYKIASSGLSLAGFVTNLFNKFYFVGGVNYAESSPHYDVGRPREFGVTARFQF